MLLLLYIVSVHLKSSVVILNSIFKDSLSSIHIIIKYLFNKKYIPKPNLLAD